MLYDNGVREGDEVEFDFEEDSIEAELKRQKEERKPDD